MSDVVTAPPLRALIYNRVSSDPSGRRISVESQDAENRAFCARQGWVVAADVTDNDRSATRFATREREGYQQVRAALSGDGHGRIDVLVCWESSRAQRDLADYVAMRDLCVANNVLLAYKGRVYNLQEGDDRFATGIDALVDEREAERIRERVLRGHRTSVRDGKPRGVVPYGYRRTYDPIGGHLISQDPDPETAVVVQEIVARILGGDTLYAIAQSLNRRRVLTPRGYRQAVSGVVEERAGWTTSNIRNLLGKQSLMGIRTHNGVPERQATWPAIVDPADWAQVQAILSDPKRARHNGGVAVRYLLSGIAECGVCGAWLRPFTNRGRPTYRCEGRVATDAKGHVSRLRAPLDAWVTLYVLRRLQDPALLEEMTGQREVVQGRAAVVAREIEELRAELGVYTASVGQRRGSAAAALVQIIDDLSARIDAKQGELSQAAGLSPVVVELAGPDAVERWGSTSLERQRQVVRELVVVRVHRLVRRGARGFDASTVELVKR